MNNDHEREMFRSLMKSFSYAMHKNTLEEMQNIVSRKLAAERSEESKMSREYLEHHPSIETDVTDEDMLLLQIDMALDSGDMKLFMQLTDELKGMGVLV